MTKLASIKAFLEPKEFAISGVSRNPRKFGFQVYDLLKKNDYKLYPVNPNADDINGEPCYKSVADLPDSVSNLYIVTRKKQTREIIQAAVDKGLKNIWIQQGSDTPEALEIAEKNDVNLIYKECMLKFADPVGGIHKFHRTLNKVFGGYPK